MVSLGASRDPSGATFVSSVGACLPSVLPFLAPRFPEAIKAVDTDRFHANLFRMAFDFLTSLPTATGVNGDELGARRAWDTGGRVLIAQLAAIAGNDFVALNWKEVAGGVPSGQAATVTIDASQSAVVSMWSQFFASLAPKHRKKWRQLAVDAPIPPAPPFVPGTKRQHAPYPLGNCPLLLAAAWFLQPFADSTVQHDRKEVLDDLTRRPARPAAQGEGVGPPPAGAAYAFRHLSGAIQPLSLQLRKLEVLLQGPGPRVAETAPAADAAAPAGIELGAATLESLAAARDIAFTWPAGDVAVPSSLLTSAAALARCHQLSGAAAAALASEWLALLMRIRAGDDEGVNWRGLGCLPELSCTFVDFAAAPAGALEPSGQGLTACTTAILLALHQPTPHLLRAGEAAGDMRKLALAALLPPVGDTITAVPIRDARGAPVAGAGGIALVRERRPAVAANVRTATLGQAVRLLPPVERAQWALQAASGELPAFGFCDDEEARCGRGGILAGAAAHPFPIGCATTADLVILALRQLVRYTLELDVRIAAGAAPLTPSSQLLPSTCIQVQDEPLDAGVHPCAHMPSLQDQYLLALSVALTAPCPNPRSAPAVVAGSGGVGSPRLIQFADLATRPWGSMEACAPAAPAAAPSAGASAASSAETAIKDRCWNRGRRDASRNFPWADRDYSGASPNCDHVRPC